jgi:uncharacterized membrane-anchored protein
MPLVTEHLREGEQVQHRWTLELVASMSALIEEDGGPPLAMGSGYGDLWERRSVEHTFTNDYPLPNEEPPIKKGDVIRMWRDR